MADFVDDEDIAGAPSDDAEAFAYYARIANEKFSKRVAGLGTDEDDWSFLHEARFSFQTYIYAIGSIYGVYPFDEAPVANIDDYGQREWRSFKAAFDRKAATLFHSRARAIQADGFLLTENAKDGIRKHLSGLRKYITESQLPEKTKKKLLDKVAEFDSALNGRQMNMAFVYGFAGFIFANLADATTIADSNIVHKLMNSVFSAAAEARAATEEFVTLSAPKAPLRIGGPSANAKPSSSGRAVPKQSRMPESGPRETFSADLDDEIPF